MYIREEMPVQLGFTDYPICPKCNDEKAKLVPIYKYTSSAYGVEKQSQRGTSEILAWKCIKCGNVIL
jgi:hypothetical protein